MEAKRRTVELAFILMFFLFTGTAVACGGMGVGLGKARGQVFTSSIAALFVPMIVLIPVELWILRKFGGLREELWSTYVVCLAAKGASILIVAFAAINGMAGGIIGAELIYSLSHFFFSYSILTKVSNNVPQTAVLISTVIPWLYSAGIPVTYKLMAYVYR